MEDTASANHQEKMRLRAHFSCQQAIEQSHKSLLGIAHNCSGKHGSTAVLNSGQIQVDAFYQPEEPTLIILVKPTQGTCRRLMYSSKVRIRARTKAVES